MEPCSQLAFHSFYKFVLGFLLSGSHPRYDFVTLKHKFASVCPGTMTRYFTGTSPLVNSILCIIRKFTIKCNVKHFGIILYPFWLSFGILWFGFRCRWYCSQHGNNDCPQRPYLSQSVIFPLLLQNSMS